MKLRIFCKACQKDRDVATSKDGTIKGYAVHTLTCGHSKLDKKIVSNGNLSRDFIYTDKLRRHQREAVDFTENANFQCLIADEMRVGKTPETLAAIRYNLRSLIPVLFVVKGSLRVQWAREIIRWVGSETAEDFDSMDYIPKDFRNLPQIILDGTHKPISGFNFYIVSMSVLHKHIETIQELNPRLIVIDESHNFKDSSATRTISLIKALKLCESLPKVICLSGSPILNRADEFFTTLNLIKPSEFPSKQRFQYDWIDYNGKISHYKVDSFREKTKSYILRREFHEVYKNDSKPQINYELVDISDSPFVKAYNEQADLLKQFLRKEKGTGAQFHGLTMGFIQKLWAITALAKSDYLCEKVEEFIDLTQEKVIIGVHHDVAVQDLSMRLAKYEPVVITGKDSGLTAKSDKRIAFRDGASKVMIASMLAVNEGVDLSFCNNVIILQRQWNLEREKQFVARLQNLFRKYPYNVDYLLAKGTIDEYFTSLVSHKAGAVNSAIKNEYDPVSVATLREFAEMCTKRI